MIYHLNEKLSMGKREATAEAFRVKCDQNIFKYFLNLLFLNMRRFDLLYRNLESRSTQIAMGFHVLEVPCVWVLLTC